MVVKESMELLTSKSKYTEYTYYLKDNKEVKHGLYKHWYRNGQLRFEWNYKDGELHGFRSCWCEDGQLLYEYYYWKGERFESKNEYDNFKNAIEESLILNKSW